MAVNKDDHSDVHDILAQDLSRQKKKNHVLSHLTFKRFATALSIHWEQLLSAFWPLVTSIMIFSGWCLIGGASFVGPNLQFIIFIISIYGFYRTFRYGLQNYQPPRASDIDRRLEQNSGLSHRPLQSLQDSLTGQDQTKSIWKAHKEKLNNILTKLTIGSPRPVLSQSDPWTLRIAAVLFLLAGFVIAGSDSLHRLKQGMNLPPLPANWLAKQNVLSAWIVPPDYTGQGPIYLTEETLKAGTPLEISANSTLEIRLSSPWESFAPVLYNEKFKIPFGQEDKKNWSIAYNFEESETDEVQSITVKRGLFSLLTVPYTVRNDSPPLAGWQTIPSTTSKNLIRIPYKGSDDYGVTKISLRVEPTIPTKEDAPFNVPLLLYGSDHRKIEHIQNIDLKSHPWAGRSVKLKIVTEDAIGQTSTSPEADIILPLMEFKHPVAKKIIAARENITKNTVDTLQDATQSLYLLLARPSTYNDDITVFLSLRSAASRIKISAGAQDAIRETKKLLWFTALHVEDNGTAMAEQELRAAIERLKAALSDPSTTEEEIAALTQDVRTAMYKYLSAMQKSMMEDGTLPKYAEGEFQTPGLDKFLSDMKLMSDLGNRDDALEMLSELQNLMDGLTTGMPEPIQKMAEQISSLDSMITRQESLLNETKKQCENPGNTGNGGTAQGSQQAPMTHDSPLSGIDMPPAPKIMNNPSMNSAITQESLRSELHGTMSAIEQQSGSLPQSLPAADNAMKQSSQALEANNPEHAIEPQKEALKQLKAAKEQAQEMMQKALENMVMFSLGSGKRDPLGRDQGEHSLKTKVKIPEQGERKKIEHILQILRRRSAEQDRPEIEREYIDRLLKQF